MACYAVDYDLKIHHGGVFKNTPHPVYTGGSTTHVHITEMKWSSLHEIARNLGHVDVINFHYRDPTTKALRLIYGEDALYDLFCACLYSKEVEIWFEHYGEAEDNFVQDDDSEYDNEENLHNDESNGDNDDSETEKDSDVNSIDNVSDEDDELMQARIHHLEQAEKKKRKSNTSKQRIPWEDREPLQLVPSNKKTYADKSLDAVNDEDSDVQSVYYDSDEHDSPCESEDDGTSRAGQQRKEPEFPVYNPNGDPFKFEPRNSMLFASVTEMKFAMRCYAVSHCRGLRFCKSGPNKLLIQCVPNCPWRIWASPSSNKRSFQIKVFHEEHICAKTYSIRCANAPFWAKVLQRRLMNNPKMKIDDMIDDILQTYKVDVSENQAYKIRQLAHSEVDKSLREHYLLVRRYAEELYRSNPGSTINVEVDRVTLESEGYFKRFYVCFGAIKRNFIEGCRKVIGVDGTFLKGYCKGEILTAVGRDGNNNIYPLAWAVVRVENNETWAWFFTKVIDDLKLRDGQGLTIISDQQKGIINAVADLLPLAEHRQCARHIYQNFRNKDFRSGVLKRLFWKAAKSGTVVEFKNVLEDIRSLDAAAAEYLEAHHPETWCRAWFSTFSTCDSVENNLCEVFNGVLVKARFKLLIPLLEDIRRYVMKRLIRQRDLLNKWSGEHRLICPRIQAKLEKNKEKHIDWRATHAGGGNRFEVRDGPLDGYTVDIERRTCTCRLWDLSGVPCTHAVSALFNSNLKPEDYLSKWYSIEECKKAYIHLLEPVNGLSCWPRSTALPMLPPKDRRMPGRPKKARRRSVHEEVKGSKSRISRAGVQMTCSKCNEKGHNRKGCKNNEVTETASVQLSAHIEGNGTSNEQGRGKNKRKQGTPHENSRSVKAKASSTARGEAPIEVTETASVQPSVNGTASDQPSVHIEGNGTSNEKGMGKNKRKQGTPHENSRSVKAKASSTARGKAPIEVARKPSRGKEKSPVGFSVCHPENRAKDRSTNREKEPIEVTRKQPPRKGKDKAPAGFGVCHLENGDTFVKMPGSKRGTYIARESSTTVAATKSIGPSIATTKSNVTECGTQQSVTRATTNAVFERNTRSNVSKTLGLRMGVVTRAWSAKKK